MPSYRRIPVTGLAVLSSIAAAVAAASEPADAELEAVIVTARSLEVTTPLELSRYGYDVEFVSSEEIRNQGFVDAPQALEMLVPGAYVAPQAGAFSYLNLALQGSRNGDVLWTVDGVRINNRLYNTTSPTDTLPASMIERMEVLKGSHGLLYGTQAVAGVINIVTRAFSDEPGGAVSLGTDSRDGIHADAWARGSLGDHRFVGWVSKDRTEGFSPYSAYQPGATTRNRRYDMDSVGLKYGFSFTDDLRLVLQGVHTEGEVDFATPGSTDVNERDEDTLSARLDYTPGGPVELFIKGYLHDWDTDYYPVLDPSAPEYWGFKDVGVSAATRINITRGLEYHFGYEFQKYTGRDDYLQIAPGGEKVHAVFGQVRTTDDFWNRGRLTAGLRYNDTGGSTATVWSASGIYNITDALYAEGSLGTSFRLPDAEQFLAREPGWVLGNQDLEPEESFNINLALGGRIDAGTRTLGWQVTGWRRKVKNLIDADTSSPPAGYEGIWANTEGTVKASGVEVLFTGDVTEALSFTTSYTWSRERDPGTGAQLANRPRNSGKLALALAPPASAWGADLALKYVGSTHAAVTLADGAGITFPANIPYGDFFAVNLGAHWLLDSAREHRLGLRIENLFDEEYATRVRSTVLSGSSPEQYFVYRNRGTPRTLYANYTYSF